jgi:hypothetical protein
MAHVPIVAKMHLFFIMEWIIWAMIIGLLIAAIQGAQAMTTTASTLDKP